MISYNSFCALYSLSISSLLLPSPFFNIDPRSGGRTIVFSLVSFIFRRILFTMRDVAGFISLIFSRLTLLDMPAFLDLFVLGSAVSSTAMYLCMIGFFLCFAIYI